MSSVCLFDIDGTLLSSGGAGQHAMEQALLEVFSVSGPYEDIRAAGRTDKAITTDLFNHHKIDISEENWTRFLNSYVSHLPKSLSSQNGQVLPGVVEILDSLSSNDAMTLGLLTGNLQVGAELKLKHYDLDHHFLFGGYGDVYHNRDDVARTAYREACTYLAKDVPSETVWVIGDTPSDVTCGRAIGAKTIAVATGIYDADSLKATDPDFLFEDFSAVADVLKYFV